MKNRCMLLTLLIGMLPLLMMAQDDMYFVTGRQKAAKNSEPRSSYVSVPETYYSGSSRSVDEYNRRGGSSYEVLPVDTGDIISFAPVEGVYPDSLLDFKATRELTRWDGYTPSQAYWEGYSQGNSDARSTWHSPWYYSSFYPWYDSWYWDPWYYDPWYFSSWHYGWYDPWYYGGYWGPYYHWGWGGYYGGWHDYYGGGSWHHGSVARSDWGGSYRSIPHGTGYGRYGGGVTGTRRGSRYGDAGAARATGSGRSTIGTTRSTASGRRTVTNPGVRSVTSGSSSSTYSVPRSSGSRSAYSGSSSGSSYSGSSSAGSRSYGGGGGGFSGGGSRGGGGGGSHSGSSRR